MAEHERAEIEAAPRRGPMAAWARDVLLAEARRLTAQAERRAREDAEEREADRRSMAAYSGERGSD